MELESTPPPLPAEAPNAAPPRLHRIGAALAVVAIVGCVLAIVLSHGREERAAESQAVEPNPLLEMIVRYQYGAWSRMNSMGLWKPEMTQQIDQALAQVDRGPADRFRVEIVRAALQSRPPDDGRMESIVAEAPGLKRDREILAEFQKNAGVVPDGDWQWFYERHGWIGRLARVQSLPKSDPEWAALTSESQRTMILMVLAFLGMLLVFIAGVVFLILILIRWKAGKLKAFLEHPGPGWGGVLLEAFAIYLCGWTVVPALIEHFIPDFPGWASLTVRVLAVLVAMFWPWWRGMQRQAWKQTLGLHKGQGFWKEVGVGVVGWVATIPVLAVCLILASFIMQKTQTEASHPILEPLTRPGFAQIAAVLLAVVWAPLAEEVMFRGLLFPGLAAWVRWALGAVLGAFIFAVIHPQGWVAVPAIMSIAIGASMLRLTRGSLVAPMAMHAVNNGSVTLLVILWAS